MVVDTNDPVSSTVTDKITSVEDSYEYCRRVTHKYGANFSVGFRFLPPQKKRAVYATYAFCRRADDIADDPGEGIDERLDDWQAELDRGYAGHPTDPITIALADSLQLFDIPRSAFVALIEGCRQDQSKSRYETFDELLHYCDLVATSISDISLSIFGYRAPEATSYGRNLSTALQLTNVTRDIGDDLERDRIYLPREELDRFGITEDDLREKRETSAMKALIEFQIERAAGYFRDAAPLIDLLDFDARFATLLMGGVYATVLGELAKDPFVPLRKRVSLSKARKIRVILSRLIRPRFI